MEQITLELSPREIRGKHNRALRRRGVTPAHVFGYGVESKALEGRTTELEQVLSHAGMSRLIELRIAGEKQPRSVLVREIQRKPVTGLLLHVDLYEIKSTKKMTAEVPVRTIGVAPAVEERLGTLGVELATLTVECLPADLPRHIDVDVSMLHTAADVVRVSDIHAPEGVAILNDEDLAVVVLLVERKVQPTVAEAEEAEVESEAEEPSDT